MSVASGEYVNMYKVPFIFMQCAAGEEIVIELLIQIFMPQTRLTIASFDVHFMLYALRSPLTVFSIVRSLNKMLPCDSDNWWQISVMHALVLVAPSAGEDAHRNFPSLNARCGLCHGNPTLSVALSCDMFKLIPFDCRFPCCVFQFATLFPTLLPFISANILDLVPQLVIRWQSGVVVSIT